MRSAAGTMSEAERGRKKRAKKSLFREQKRRLSRLDYENIIVETIDPDNPADGIMESLEERMEERWERMERVFDRMLDRVEQMLEKRRDDRG